MTRILYVLVVLLLLVLSCSGDDNSITLFEPSQPVIRDDPENQENIVASNVTKTDKELSSHNLYQLKTGSILFEDIYTVNSNIFMTDYRGKLSVPKPKKRPKSLTQKPVSKFRVKQ